MYCTTEILDGVQRGKSFNNGKRLKSDDLVAAYEEDDP
jgi:hypothetical protein